MKAILALLILAALLTACVQKRPDYDYYTTARGICVDNCDNPASHSIAREAAK